eukprot:jgi/Bigna1/143107/aug1.75_g17815
MHNVRQYMMLFPIFEFAVDWKLWVNKLGSESENVNWILANTKICPKCKVHIEKNQGCNHMTCRKCRHEFCWICKGEWRSHRGCGGIKYEQKKEEENALKAKTELSKYMYYVTRYEAHEKSMKFAQDQLDGCNKRLAELRSVMPHARLKDVQFYEEALRQIVDCRRSLMCVYAYGYFSKVLPKNNSESKLFEMSLETLEEITDQLQEGVEKPTKMLADSQVRMKIMRMTQAINTYRENMLGVVKKKQISLLKALGGDPSRKDEEEDDEKLMMDADRADACQMWVFFRAKVRTEVTESGEGFGSGWQGWDEGQSHGFWWGVWTRVWVRVGMSTRISIARLGPGVKRGEQVRTSFRNETRAKVRAATRVRIRVEITAKVRTGSGPGSKSRRKSGPRQGSGPGSRSRRKSGLRQGQKSGLG